MQRPARRPLAHAEHPCERVLGDSQVVVGSLAHLLSARSLGHFCLLMNTRRTLNALHWPQGTFGYVMQ